MTFTDKYNRTALIYSSWKGHLDVVKYFIGELGVDPNHKSSENKTAYDYALENGHTEVTDFLDNLPS